MPASSPRELLAWLLRRRRRYQVAGPSMLPTLQPGQTLLVDPRAPKRRALRVGELVVLRHPREPELTMVKRVHRLLPDGGVEVRGDNPSQSTDSRHFGPVPPASLIACVVCTLP